MTGFDYGKWVENIGRLKKNRQNVPEDILRTKYAGPYNALLSEIRKQTREMILDCTLSGFPIMKEWEDEEFPEDKKDVETIILKINSTFELARISGSMKRIHDAVFREYDPQKAMGIAGQIREDIEREAYLPYWQKHCSLQDEGRVIYNDLVGMEWASKNLWKATGEKWCAIITWPPPEEMIKKAEGRKDERDQKNRI